MKDSSFSGDSVRPRILHIITALSTGGAEVMLLKLLSATQDRFHHAVVSLKDEGTIGPQIRSLGIPVHSLDLHRGFLNPLVAFSVRSVIRRFGPQLLQGWMPHGNLVASLAAVLVKGYVPVLWNIRMSLSADRAEPIRTRAIIRLGALASWNPKAIIYNSQSGARQHEALGYRASKRVFIPNGFDCQMFRPDENARRQVRNELAVPENAFLIGMVARNHPMKDHLSFLRAARIIAARYPWARFVLAGSNVTKEDPTLSDAIAQLRLENQVFLLGRRTDTPQVTAALDLACSTSFWGEGFSNAMGEAMACGIPCVATDVGDNAYIVADTGVIVPPRQPEAFAQAVAQLMDAGSARRRQLGERARQRIEREFSLASVSRQYEELYKTSIAQSA